MNPDCPHGGRARCEMCDAYWDEALHCELSDYHIQILDQIACGYNPYQCTKIDEQKSAAVRKTVGFAFGFCFLDTGLHIEQLRIKGLIQWDRSWSADTHYSCEIWVLTAAGEAALVSHGRTVPTRRTLVGETPLPLPGMGLPYPEQSRPSA